MAGNRIPRNATHMVVECLTATTAGEPGTVLTLTRTENGWIGQRKDGKSYYMFLSHIRNPNFTRILQIN